MKAKVSLLAFHLWIPSYYSEFVPLMPSYLVTPVTLTHIKQTAKVEVIYNSAIKRFLKTATVK